MPYMIQKSGSKYPMYCVYKKNANGSAGAKVGCHDSPEKAKAQLRALYAKEGKKSEKALTEDQMAVMLLRLREVLKLDEPDPVGDAGPETLITATGGVITPIRGSYNITINTPNVTFSPPTETLQSPPTSDDTSSPNTDFTSVENFAPIRLYFREGEQTPDGRVIDPNATNFNRPPPYAIRLQTTQPESGGHAGAVVCGVITKIARDGLTIICDGILDLTQDAGRQANQLITNKTMQTWSPDLGDAVVDVETNAADEDPNEHAHLDEVDHYVKATFLGATLCAMPALASAVVELLDHSGNILVPAPERVGPESAPSGDVVQPGFLKYVTDRQDAQSAEIAASGEEVTACAGQSHPPASFFTDPQLPELQRFTTITEDGRIFGHSAGRGECHIGFRKRCVTIDEIADCSGDGNFEYAKPGYVITADGTSISTGPITIKGGHAARGLPWQEALSHYDDPSAAVADVIYGTDQFGVWYSGAIRPTATVEQIRTLLASGVSLDAREVDGKLRYLATCAVNVPGYPKLAVRLASAEPDDEHVIALISPGPPPIPTLTDVCGDTE